ncbi:MAG TPA: precorrin-3B C(17)-methyltransferase [Kamptonema sp.]|nr:precorrin-3B C(17)-methyltransferase [Kamptonema sp.]
MTDSLFSNFLPLAAIATTPTAAKRLQPFCQSVGASLWLPESLTGIKGTQVYSGSLKEHLGTIWQSHRAFIFCLATGAVVRSIAPLLEHKSCDPAIIVIDEAGKFVISLCSGHQGGADQLARAIALELNATAVLTGSSVGLGLPAVDMLGIPFGWSRGDGNWTGVAAAISRGENVEVIQEVGSTLWQENLPEGHPFYLGLDVKEDGNKEDLSIEKSPITKARIWISFTQRRFSPDSELPKVQWHPKVLWVGIGCERGTSQELIELAISQVCRNYHLAVGAIAGIATIDIKSDEIGLIELCQRQNWPLKTFSAEILRSIPVPNPSNIVAAEVGTPSVAESAALVAACGTNISPGSLLVSKQIFRLEDQPGAVTVAIALAEKEYTGRTGKLLLIGTGPGQLSQMTPAAQSAIALADVVIGYTLYMELISSLLRPGQIVESSPITQERQRAERAISLANWGLTVAVISSGDCGIYGMAGLVLEELRSQGWDGKTPAVQVFPGITALQAAASRVGAPLMHDFCAISLSDLLTPWEVIEKRLNAAAIADFVVALYNPRSQTRIQQLAQAQAIFRQHRDGNTPVAIARSVYREDEQITLTTLDKLLDLPVDMLTVIIIGNQSTRSHADWMITPRGYLGFN